ncbi:digestive cysteine proteinase 3 isoform X2 [Cylas formicarius]|uniref:digestive cysteine proteinase 3 isoform X2 n=1 Tax=Cylas formicarius TaxID=197179 RepID=UPI002958C2B7|nr:digestive cysteine proteinase 3 isoform X2 [Cylas formicarius]
MIRNVAAISTILLLVNGAVVPKWSETYRVKGILHIPYAEIDEPFFAWYDGPDNQSRIDYYGEMAKTYQLSGTFGYGTSVKIVPVTTEEKLNAKTCLQVNGSSENPIGVQTVLPDLTNFQLAGNDNLGEKWELTTTIGQKVNKYSLWVRYKTDSQNNAKIAIPVRYEMRGYNSLLGSHYDHYYIEYFDFDISSIPEQTFQIDPALTCSSFPGPGDKHIATFNPIAEFIRPEQQGHVDIEFDKFVKKHSKHYVDALEEIVRKEVFRQNLRLIHSVNRQKRGYTLTVNHLADKTENELKVLRGKTFSGVYNGGLPFPYKNIKSSDLPVQVDWRLYGAVTPVKDQSVCGSCWSFGTVGAVEGAYFLKNGGNLVRLSQQALIDCSWGYGNNGCDGGEDFRAYQWILKHGGIPTEEDYGQYLGQDSYCHADKVRKVAKISGWINVTTNDENALRLALFKHGPISVAIDASQKTFSFYSNGIYYDENCKNKEDELDHAVLAVGYGTMNGKNYWLIKNSWSNYWGNDGYILMSSKNNNCGVMTTPTYVVM